MFSSPNNSINFGIQYQQKNHYVHKKKNYEQKLAKITEVSTNHRQNVNTAGMSCDKNIFI
jgi:hypothetical protein